MKIKHEGLDIPEENPFENDKLGRKPYAKVLTEIVKNYADGFVMAINNEWGTGKTTFVKMWQQQLKNESFQTIYFNAWENDFSSDPLVALTAELEMLPAFKNNDRFKSIIKKSATIIKNVAPAVLSAIAKKYIDTGIITDAIKNTTKAATEIVEKEIEEYASKKQTISDFRDELGTLVKELGNDLPLVFIIDELDRCRPNYAVELLEQVKHLFSVPGIVFVLSIDKAHLASAVRGFYGSEQINTDEYLRRFIDLEYSIPEPSTEQFVKYLFEYYEFKDFISLEGRTSRYRDDYFILTDISIYLFSRDNATLRQQEKIFAHLRLVLCSFRKLAPIFPFVIFLLIYLKVMKEEIYLKIGRKAYTLQELSDEYRNKIFSINEELKDIDLTYGEALLLWLYTDNTGREELINKDENGKWRTTITKKGNENNKNLTPYFEKFKNSIKHNRNTLSTLLKKINLTESISTYKQ